MSYRLLQGRKGIMDKLISHMDDIDYWGSLDHAALTPQLMRYYYTYLLLLHALANVLCEEAIQ